MAVAWDALRLALLYVGWPGFVLLSAYTVSRAVRFYRGMRDSAPGLLVLLTISGWTVTLAAAAFIMTLFLQRDPEAAGPAVLPMFILWAGSLITIVWVMQRWGAEAATLDTYYGEVEKMERMKSGFINHIAHELNTPITPLRMQVAVFRKKTLGPLTDKQEAALDRMERNIQRLSTLVEQVLMANIIQTGGMHLERRRHDVKDVVIQAARAAALARPGMNVEIEGDAVFAEIDRDRFGYAVQALFEYLGRAVQGETTLRVRVAPEGSQARVDITHDGPPLGGKEFGMFHDPVEASRRDGLGVSLFNVRGIIDLHRGVIQTPPQAPTMVRIRVPVVAGR